MKHLLSIFALKLLAHLDKLELEEFVKHQDVVELNAHVHQVKSEEVDLAPTHHVLVQDVHVHLD